MHRGVTSPPPDTPFDFGAHISGGTGSVVDPYVIVPCSELVATRTQQSLVQDVCRRRNLYVRFASAAFVDSGRRVQRVRFDTVEFTPTTIETLTSTIYFDVSAVDGEPNAMGLIPVWWDDRTSFVAPDRFGWLHFTRRHPPQPDGGLNAALDYSAPEASGTLYIYGPVEAWQEGTPEARFQRHFETICNSLSEINSNPERPWPPTTVGPFMTASFLIGTKISFVALTVLEGNFIKLRITCEDDRKRRALMMNSIDDLGQLIQSSMAPH